jgi:hypothetical protein
MPVILLEGVRINCNYCHRESLSDDGLCLTHAVRRDQTPIHERYDCLDIDDDESMFCYKVQDCTTGKTIQITKKEFEAWKKAME